ncbi:MAG: hypothetical protein KAH17_10275 [Bacteroidales bacterium]|nr:hypothetical protein [Bacteroidales bacterium]
MKKIGFVLLLMLAALWSCEYETIVPGEVVVDGPVSYSEDIAPVLDNQCSGCHGGATAPDLRIDKSWGDLNTMNLVDTNNPADSELVIKIESGHATSGNLTALQKALILKWIEQGALDN